LEGTTDFRVEPFGPSQEGYLALNDFAGRQIERALGPDKAGFWSKDNFTGFLTKASVFATLIIPMGVIQTK